MGVTELAREALEIYIEAEKFNKRLDEKKEELRALANGNKKEIVVESLGKIHISAPTDGKETVVIAIDEEKLESVPELKTKLLAKGVLKQTVKKVSGAAAKVTFKPNV